MSAYCLDGLLMKGIVRCDELSDESNCRMKVIARCEEFGRQELHALSESRKQESGYYDMNLLGNF